MTPDPKPSGERSGTPRKWDADYHRELEYAEQQAKECEKEGDTHGKCFHEGRASGIINIDIMACQLFDALETALAESQREVGEARAEVRKLWEEVKRLKAAAQFIQDLHGHDPRSL